MIMLKERGLQDPLYDNANSNKHPPLVSIAFVPDVLSLFTAPVHHDFITHGTTTTRDNPASITFKPTDS